MRIIPVALALLLSSIGLVGCKKTAPKTPDDEGGAAAYAVPAKPREAIVGQWTIDTSRLAEQPHLAAMPPEKRALALEMAENVTRSMALEFTADRFSLSMAGKTIEGAYSVANQTGRSLTLATTANDGTADQLKLEFTDRGLIWHADDDESLPLIRKR